MNCDFDYYYDWSKSRIEEKSVPKININWIGMFNAVDILCDVMVYAYYYLQSLLFHSKGAKTSNESIRERVESVK